MEEAGNFPSSGRADFSNRFLLIGMVIARSSAIDAELSQNDFWLGGGLDKASI